MLDQTAFSILAMQSANPEESFKSKPNRYNSSNVGITVPAARAFNRRLSSSDFLEDGIKEMDVLSGRNTTTWSHKGNRCFQRVVVLMLGEFQEAKGKDSRNHVISQVIAVIRQSGGRFLRKNPDTNEWEELPVDKVRTKVAHALRDGLDGRSGRRRRRQLRAQQRQEHQRTSSVVPSSVFSREEVISDGSSIASSTNTNSDHDWVDANEEDEDSDFLEHINAVLGPIPRRQTSPPTAFGSNVNGGSNSFPDFDGLSFAEAHIGRGETFETLRTTSNTEIEMYQLMPSSSTTSPVRVVLETLTEHTSQSSFDGSFMSAS
jgi:hypothetical protein